MNNLRLICLIFLACVGVCAFGQQNISQSQPGTGWKAPESVVEKLSKQDNRFNYKEEKVPAYVLPELLKSNDRTMITDPELWQKIRRPEVLELFRKNVYGRVPETRYSEEFKTILIDSSVIGGKATLKQSAITIKANGKSLTFNLYIITPNKIKHPVPVFLLIDPWLAEKKVPVWKEKNEYFPVEEAVRRGYGMAVFDAAELDPDNFDNFKNGIHGVLDINRPPDAWGTIAAWAWGASRCLDYLLTDKNVAPDKIAVVGHSRAGKTALWAGAQDERFAMVISNESGAGGAALARRKFGETVERLNTVFPHWFCSNFKLYNDRENELPVDMHMLLALVAPRALYIDCADEDLWGDPHGSYISLYNAVPAYNLLGLNSTIPEEMPPLNKPVISGCVGFHIRDGVHNLLLKDWDWFMDFADRELK